MRTRLSAFVYIAAAVATLTAQGDPAQPTFRAGANYVRVDMYATEDGVAVSDIRADEIEVFEDGVPQKIEDFEHVIVRPASQLDTVIEPDGLGRSREAAADPRARVFVIFLDTYHTQLGGSANVRKPLVSFLDRVLGPDDLVALMTPEMGASDIALGRKTDVIANILRDEWWGRRARVADEDPKEELYRVCAFRWSQDFLTPGAFPGEALANEMIARRREKLTLDALEDLMVHLGGLRDERKAVVVVTEGWLLFQENAKLLEGMVPVRGPSRQEPIPEPRESGSLGPGSDAECDADRQTLAYINHQEKLRRIGEDANRGNVTFYPVFARGLTAFDAPIGPDRPPSPLQDSANLRTRQNTLRNLAADTDGEALINTNNIEGGLKRIAADLSSYYLFGYYSTNAKLDGRFRSISVKVKRPGVRVRARRGYRGRTADEVAAAATAEAPDPTRDAVASALNTVAGINARSSFRVRPAAWSRDAGGSVAGTMWVVGELDYRTRQELAWTAGAQAEVTVVGSDGTVVLSRTVEVPANEGTFGIQVPDTGALGPGDYAVSVRMRPEAGSDVVLSDTVRVIVPERASPIGEAVMWRRGPSTGIRFLRTADPRFQRSERLKLELASVAGATASARMLDRTGQPLQVPVRVSERTDEATGLRWIVAEATLAPLAPGDYAIEVAVGEERQLTGFRITP